VTGEEFCGNDREPNNANALCLLCVTEVEIRLYVDSDHAGDEWSEGAPVIFMNSIPLIWFSRRQPVELPVFGAEFVAMKNSMEAVQGLTVQVAYDGYSGSMARHYVWGQHV
jgi:hypothetical protein